MASGPTLRRVRISLTAPSGSYATRVYIGDDGGEFWISLSGSDKAKGIGARCAAGRFGDAFDLFVHYEHGGNFHAALAAWRGECDLECRRVAAEKLVLAQATAADDESEFEPDPATVERLMARSDVRMDDASLALAWLEEDGDCLVYCDDGFWRRFEGGHWRRMDDAAARKLLAAYLRGVGAMQVAMAEERLKRREIDDAAAKDVKKWEGRLRASAKRRAVFEQAIDEAARERTDSFDADPMLLGIPGGRVIDLRTGQEREGSPEDRISLLTAVAPAPPGAVPERWLQFLGQISDGRPGWVTFLQRLAGYALTGSADAQSIFFLTGSGANGKSVLRDVLLRLVGGYGVTVAAEVFMRSPGAQHPTSLARMAGARLVMASELPHGRVWNDQLVKDVTGGEAVTARFMYKDEFSFTPRATVIVAGNTRPSFASADSAMTRRLVLVECRRVFAENERDPRLAESLLAQEGPAILRWIIEGAVAWHAAGGGRSGLAIPDDVLAAGYEYAEDEDIVLQFLADRQHRNPQGWVIGAFFKAPELYPEFRLWAERAGMKPWTQRTFEKALSEGAARYGLRKVRSNAARGYEVERLLAASRVGDTGPPALNVDPRVVGLRKALERHRFGSPDEAEGLSS